MLQILPKLKNIKVPSNVEETDRPYLNAWRPDLENLAESNWHDVVVLRSVFGELDRRMSTKAIRLQETVADRIEELELEQKFRWPTTVAEVGLNRLTPFDASTIGMLKVLGYRTGKSGLPQSERRSLLRSAFTRALPSRESSEYMDEWAKPRSSRRLQKLAESLATFARNAKRQEVVDKSLAIKHWEADLRFLKKTYYDESSFSFDWPRT